MGPGESGQEILQQRETPQEVFFNALVKGNGEFPQIGAGMDIFAGSALIPHMDETGTTWKSFLSTDITPEQLTEYRTRVTKLHKAFAIPVDIPDDDMLRELYENTRKNVYSTSLELAKLTASELFPSLGRQLMSEENIDALDTFFQDSQYKEHKAVLITLWGVGAQALTSPEGKLLAKENREAWRGGALGRDNREITAPTLEKLQTLVTKHLSEELPRLQEQITFSIPPHTIDTFIAHTIY